jgi:hypothetical protein
MMEPVRTLAGLIARAGGPPATGLSDHVLLRNLTAAYDIIARAGLILASD